MGRFVQLFLLLLLGLIIFVSALQGQTGSLLAVFLDPGDMTQKG